MWVGIFFKQTNNKKKETNLLSPVKVINKKQEPDKKPEPEKKDDTGESFKPEGDMTLQESNELQAIMALDDAGIKADINKRGEVVVKKKVKKDLFCCHKGQQGGQ